MTFDMAAELIAFGTPSQIDEHRVLQSRRWSHAQLFAAANARRAQSRNLGSVPRRKDPGQKKSGRKKGKTGKR